ncbi:MAG: mycofactocin biosynthesis peptidyl-dipeptidase MftE [Microbacterium sp.]
MTTPPGRAARPSLGERTTGEIGDGPIVLVPVGATEQHGPHLPLDTDARIASAVASAVARELRGRGRDAVVAPAIAYGASGEHEGFPGTVSIGTEALRALLIEYGRSACAWAGRLVFVNGHGGNLDAVTGAVERLAFEGRSASWAPCAPGRRGAGLPADAHAGRTETSLLLHLAPDLVRTERIEQGQTAPLAELLPRMRSGGVRAVSPNGVLGDPRGASAEEGRELLAAIVSSVVDRAEEEAA